MDVTRRSFIEQAGMVVGGAIAVGSLASCGSDSNTKADAGQTSQDGAGCQPCKTPDAKVCPTPADAGPAKDALAKDAAPTGPLVSDFPYEKHIKAGYQLDAAPVKETAYHQYYAGGCCHGAYRGLLEHLAKTAGAPFNLLPLDFGKFGGGGIAGYGSICGAVLGGVLVINQIVADATARTALMTELMRWYETFAFPIYLPTTIDTAESGLTKDFSASGIVALQHAPKAHLCHSSVSSWCAKVGVSASGADKKARCARLTADVAGKAVEMLNTYLADKKFTASAIDAKSAGCLTCHGPATTKKPVAAGMSCGSCHVDKLTGHP